MACICTDGETSAAFHNGLDTPIDAALAELENLSLLPARHALPRWLSPEISYNYSSISLLSHPISPSAWTRVENIFGMRECVSFFIFVLFL